MPSKVAPPPSYYKGIKELEKKVAQHKGWKKQPGEDDKARLKRCVGEFFESFSLLVEECKKF